MKQRKKIIPVEDGDDDDGSDNRQRENAPLKQAFSQGGARTGIEINGRRQRQQPTYDSDGEGDLSHRFYVLHVAKFTGVEQRFAVRKFEIGEEVNAFAVQQIGNREGGIMKPLLTGHAVVVFGETGTVVLEL